MTPGPEHLASTPHVDALHPAIQAFARRIAADAPRVDAAVALYLAVRDGWRYTPWNVRFERADFVASAVLARDPAEGHCIDKALLLAASCRAVGIPSRLHFADVRNHLGTARLQARLGTDRLVFHGYCELWLDGRWVACTPAFNAALCEHLGVPPLAFDGRRDSVFQPHEDGGYMDYLVDHGSFADIPFERMLDAWREHYGAGPGTGWPPRSV